ncbi:MAG: formylglycine-generating enzyme family protein [Paludibacteraceae bacterium]|nr:formylglycine-generating enzyme family protein [Paludibacteraceae bacterium]
MKHYIILLFVLALTACSSGNKPMSNVFTVNDVEFKMIYVEGGSFVMGTNDTIDTYPRERPAHKVRVNSFYIAETEVTQELWETVMNENPSRHSDYKQLPVENVTWAECQEFIARLNELTEEHFSLPTEAEWEFAATGGRKSKSFMFSGSNYPPEIGWIMDNSGNETHGVKEKMPNELGIYDMTGNVWEWCQDWFATDYYSFSPEDNPQGPELDPNLPADSVACHPVRGGGFSTVANRCRNTHRAGVDPEIPAQNYGLRLVLR